MISASLTNNSPIVLRTNSLKGFIDLWTVVTLGMYVGMNRLYGLSAKAA